MLFISSSFLVLSGILWLPQNAISLKVKCFLLQPGSIFPVLIDIALNISTCLGSVSCPLNPLFHDWFLHKIQSLGQYHQPVLSHAPSWASLSPAQPDGWSRPLLASTVLLLHHMMESWQCRKDQREETYFEMSMKGREGEKGEHLTGCFRLLPKWRLGWL